jgi:hypothetical protein
MPHTVGSAAGFGNVLANSMKKPRTQSLGQSLGSLPALVLVGALCFSMVGPALADFESAVTAYETGTYQEAQTEFEILAAAGDERAVPYLEKIRKQFIDEERTDGSLTSTISERVASNFDGSDRPNLSSESKGTTRDRGSSTASRSPEGASRSDVVNPQRRSVWSAIFHLPADATVIGLQYVAQFLEAENFSRELQSLSRHGDKITLSILAGFWWLVIIKGLVGIGVAISRFMKVATTIEERNRYG